MEGLDLVCLFQDQVSCVAHPDVDLIVFLLSLLCAGSAGVSRWTVDGRAWGQENTGTGTPHDGRGDGQLFPKPRLFFLNFTYHLSYPRVLRNQSDAPPRGSVDKGKQRK